MQQYCTNTWLLSKSKTMSIQDCIFSYLIFFFAVLRRVLCIDGVVSGNVCVHKKPLTMTENDVVQMLGLYMVVVKFYEKKT